MAYRSPFHFLPEGAASLPLDPSTLQRAKKKLLAEFELNEPGSDGFSKNDLLQWFDHLKPEELEFHKYIYDHKPLLNFLEKGVATNDPWIATLPDNASLQKFVFTLVQQQYDPLFADAFRSQNIDRIRELSQFPLPDIEKKGRYYYSGTLHLLTSYYHQLLQLAKDWDPTREQALREFIGLPFFYVLPHLPPYFQAMRDEFALTLIRLAEELADDKFKQIHLANDLSILCSKIGASASAQETISAIQKEKIVKDQNTDTRQSDGKGKGCLIWIVVIIVILNLLRLVVSAVV